MNRPEESALLSRTSRGRSPRSTFISTDWASSSRLWPVASFVAPAGRARGQRLLPQDAADAAGLGFPALKDRVQRIPEHRRKCDVTVFHPSSRARRSADRTVSSRYPLIPSSTVTATRRTSPGGRAGEDHQERSGVLAPAQAHRDGVARHDHLPCRDRICNAALHAGEKMGAAEVALRVPLEEDRRFPAERAPGLSLHARPCSMPHPPCAIRMSRISSSSPTTVSSVMSIPFRETITSRGLMPSARSSWSSGTGRVARTRSFRREDEFHDPTGYGRAGFLMLRVIRPEGRFHLASACRGVDRPLRS